ncbi:hypothetical protein DXG01_011610, partial [Tephrocybe rancida]
RFLPTVTTPAFNPITPGPSPPNPSFSDLSSISSLTTSSRQSLLTLSDSVTLYSSHVEYSTSESSDPQTPLTPPTPPVTPAPRITHRSRMAQPNVTSFHGGDEQENENPRDFINSVQRYFMDRDPPFDDASKVNYLKLCLKDGSPSAEWFLELDDDRKDTWAAALMAFNERWPQVRAATKTKGEKQEELEKARIGEADLGKKIKVNGVETWTHVAWADRVQRLVRAIPDDGSLLVKAARDNMAPSLRALVPHTNDTWATFTKAVREVSVIELREKMKDREELESLKRRGTQPPLTPLKALASMLSKVQLGPPLPPPNFGQTKTVSTPAHTAPATPKYRTDQEKWAIIERLPPPLPSTDANRAT